MLNKEQIQKIEKIEGYLDVDEGLLLYKLGNNLSDNNIALEVGSFKGKSTVWTASGIKNSGVKAQVVAVDHGVGDPEAGIMNTKDILMNNIEENGVSHIVKPIFMTSQEAIKNWHEPIDMLFIDAAHDYYNVKEDFKWAKFLKNGGYIVFHDVLNPAEGPARVYIEEVIKSLNFSDFGAVESIMFARKNISRRKRLGIQESIVMYLLYLWLFLTRVINKLPKRGFRKRVVRFTMKSCLRKIVRFFAPANV